MVFIPTNQEPPYLSSPVAPTVTTLPLCGLNRISLPFRTQFCTNLAVGESLRGTTLYLNSSFSLTEDCCGYLVGSIKLETGI